MPITTAGELKRWLFNQPDDKPVHFRFVDQSGDIHKLSISEAWPFPETYHIEFEEEEQDAEKRTD